MLKSLDHIALIANPENQALYSVIDQILVQAREMHTTFLCSKKLYEGIAAFSSAENITHIEKTVDESESVERSDLVLTVGGDGTILYAAQLVRVTEKPILGVNTGRLGFLSTVQPNQVGEAFKAVKSGYIEIDKRALIKASKKGFPDVIALNEIAITKSDTSSLIKLSVSYEGEAVNTYWSDGLIISTPTGSTAYNLSSGGPIVYPNTEVVVITPLNPHNLATRPLILPNGKITIGVEQRDGAVRMSYDSFNVDLGTNPQNIEITAAYGRLNLVKMPNQGYFETLRDKLMWGKDFRD